MSINQTVNLSSGVVVSFWTLKSLNLDAVNKIATICMTGYLDAVTFNNGNDPATATTISIVFVPTNPLPPEVTVLAALYSRILQDPFFQGAQFNDDGL